MSTKCHIQLRSLLTMLIHGNRNAMQVEYSEYLKPILKTYEEKLQIQSVFFPEHEIVERYLNRGFGNAYNFDQEDRLNEAI